MKALRRTGADRGGLPLRQDSRLRMHEKRRAPSLTPQYFFFFWGSNFLSTGGGLRGVPKPELRFSIAAGRIEASLIYPCERSSVHVLEERERTLQIDEAIPGLGHECLWVG